MELVLLPTVDVGRVGRLVRVARMVCDRGGRQLNGLRGGDGQTHCALLFGSRSGFLN